MKDVRKPRRMTREARRDDLIAAALDLFSTRSPETVSVDDVVTRAQVSRPLFYRYFSSISELHLAALRGVTDGLIDRLALRAVGEPEDRLRGALTGFFEFAAEYRAGFLALLRGGSVIATPSTDAVVDAVRDRAVELILESFAIRAPSPLLLLTLRCWTATVEGTVLTWLQGAIPRAGLEDWLVDQLTAMLQVTKARPPRGLKDALPSSSGAKDSFTPSEEVKASFSPSGGQSRRVIANM